MMHGESSKFKVQSSKSRRIFHSLSHRIFNFQFSIFNSLFVLLFIASGTAFAQDAFRSRCDSVLRVYSSAAQPAGWPAAIALLGADSTRPRGVAMLASLAAPPSRFAMDRLWMMAAWCMEKPALPDSLAARIREIWSRDDPAPSWVEHDRVAWFTASLLAAEQFGADQTWSSGRTTAEVRADAKGYLRAWMDELTTQGQREFDSPQYAPVFIAAMLLLHDHSSDAGMRAAAGTMLDWLFADFAHDDLDGVYAGAHSWESTATAAFPGASPMSALAWLYFGQGTPAYDGGQVIAARSTYRVPVAIAAMAMNDGNAFESWEAKRTARRFGAREGIVMKHLYRTPHYAVGSMAGGIASPLGQHTWGVTWTGGGPDRALFSLHPYSAAARLEDFVPLAHPIRARTLEALDPQFLMPRKLVGASPYERVYQHRNTVIALYDVPADVYFPVVNCVLPVTCRSFEADTLLSPWIFIELDSAYIAVRPLGAYRLTDTPQMRRIVMGPGHAGFVVQVADALEAGSFAAFHNRVLKTDVDVRAFANTGRVTYRTMFGDDLTCGIDGDERTTALGVNGAEQKPDPNLLFNSRWMKCTRGTGVLTVTSPEGELRLDGSGRGK